MLQSLAVLQGAPSREQADTASRTQAERTSSKRGIYV
jgi:hypothetical protein